MKIKDFKYNKEDIITTDRYLEFCKNNNICYIKTDYFITGSLMWRNKLHPDYINRKIVTGHSDFSITDNIAEKFDTILCTNRSTDNKNVYGIPLGITNDCQDGSDHYICGNQDMMVKVSNETIEKKNLLYLNFRVSTYSEERQVVFDKFANEEFVKTGETIFTLEARKRFLREIKSSKFILCPRGNGIDTHRTWEALYMGSIPIIKYENAHHLFTDLPILFIKEWSEICEGSLNQKYEEMINKDWNMDKLKISFWQNFIKKQLE